jgi:hypothetical protein
LKPKFARRISIGAGAPLASLRSCHPDDVGKSFPHTPLGFESRRLKEAGQRRGRDSNPRYSIKSTPVFETGSISRSDTSPGVIDCLLLIIDNRLSSAKPVESYRLLF